MSDVVIELPVRIGEEAQLFGAYLSQFMERLLGDAEQWADGDAPYLMVCSNPVRDMELKVLTFQQHSAAQAFSAGWAMAKRVRAANGRG